MCGILGYASTSATLNGSAVPNGLQRLEHRGPDDMGQWCSPDGRVALGHRRLSIIDLTAGGHQPMQSHDGSSVIVFNGEIFNYRDLRQELGSLGHQFRTASDTEVILAAYRQWDTRCVERLNGQFALAIHDQPRQRLFLARDRAGEKPLYYRCDAAGLRFASELKALMAAPDFAPSIDHEALDCYLAMGYVPGDRCILRGVRKLPPAHAMTFDLGTRDLRVWPYWQLPEFEAASRTNDEALLDELQALLADAVRRQLVADVPVGILLSGGVDSSIVTALAAEAAPRVKTFTVKFPGYGTFDESGHARLIARHFETEHLELEAEATTVDLLPALAKQYDEPMVDSSMIPTFLVTRLVRQHCTVALGGDGGDELFGGYTHYRRLLWLQRATRLIPLALRRFGAARAAGMLPVGLKGRNWIQAAGADWASDIPGVEGVFDARTRRGLMRRHDWRVPAEEIRADRTPRHADLLQRATRMDFTNYLAEDILVKSDRASMLNSLEMRAPFLDHRVVEFAFGRVPSDRKATPDGLKLLLKQLCRRLLPAEFNQHRKQGFSIPIDEWLRRPEWERAFREVLLDRAALFAPRIIEGMLEGQHKGRRNGERLFALQMFELWRRHYNVAF